MSDLISRQDAIDALAEHEKSNGHNYTLFVDIVSECAEIIRDLPSAHPELDEWCTNCKEYDHERHCCPRYNRVIRETLAEISIVRCKDCKHRPSGTGVNHDLEFPHDEYICPCRCEDFWYSWMPDDDWYCANGERREDGRSDKPGNGD